METRRWADQHAWEVETVPKELQERRHLRNALIPLFLIALSFCAQLSVVATPCKRCQVHHKNHVHGRNLHLGDRYTIELTNTMSVGSEVEHVLFPIRTCTAYVACKR